MRKNAGFQILSLALLAGALPLSAGEKPQDFVAPPDVVTGNNAFALDLYAKLKDQQGNLFFSPYSISTALAMTYAGARGQTEKEVATVFHFDAPQDKLHPAFSRFQGGLAGEGEKRGYEISVANRLWGQVGYRFLDPFLEITERHYGARLTQLDFKEHMEEARQAINAWVEKKTHDRIQELLKPGTVNADTALVLTNAIYFKGDWASQFKKSAVRNEPFFISAERTIKAPLMCQTGEFGYLEGDGFQALEMPYAGKEISMVVFLPATKDGLTDLGRSITADSLEGWLSGLRQRKVEVGFPKFKMTSEFELKGTLSDMGMPLAFSGGADFSGMTGKRDFCISAVIHKAFVGVNEEGTEAAAATGVVVGTISLPPSPPIFRADHPFLFLIRDNRTGSILFMGRVTNPQG